MHDIHVMTPSPGEGVNHSSRVVGRPLSLVRRWSIHAVSIEHVTIVSAAVVLQPNERAPHRPTRTPSRGGGGFVYALVREAAWSSMFVMLFLILVCV